MKLALSIILFLLAFLSWVSVVFYFLYGIPLGFLFFAFAVWLLASWQYKKPIPLRVGKWLLLLPVLGLLPLATYGNFGLAVLFFDENSPPSQIPWWGIFLGAFDQFGLPLLWFGALFLTIRHFFREVQKMA